MQVLVAVDGSDEAAAAVLRAMAPYLEAADVEASVVTFVDPKEVRAAERGGTRSEAPRPAGDLSGGSVPVTSSGRTEVRVTRGQAIEEVIEEHRTGLRKLVDAHLPGIDAQIHVDVADDVPRAIIGHARASGASLIAIGTRGRGGIQRALLGSVAEAVIRSSPVPVLVVREGMGAGAGE